MRTGTTARGNANGSHLQRQRQHKPTRTRRRPSCAQKRKARANHCASSRRTRRHQGARCARVGSTHAHRGVWLNQTMRPCRAARPHAQRARAQKRKPLHKAGPRHRPPPCPPRLSRGLWGSTSRRESLQPNQAAPEEHHGHGRRAGANHSSGVTEHALLDSALL